MLDINWKKWEKYLLKFAQTKNNILDLRPNTGETTCWFLNNLCINPQSIVFSVDTWNNNTNKDVDFNIDERKFDSNIETTGKTSQLVKIKNNISTALVDLITTNSYRFNIIYLNSSYDASNLYNDIILLWQLLDDESILILDEYQNGDLEIAIDSFLNRYLIQMDILYRDYQLVIKKNTQKEIKSKSLHKYADLINKVNSYTLHNLFYTIRQKIKQRLNYKLILQDIPNEYLSELGYDDTYIKILSQIDFSKLPQNRCINLNCLLYSFIKYTKATNILDTPPGDTFNPYQKIMDIYKLLHYNSESSTFENLNDIYDNNLLTIKKKLNYLNCTFSPHPNNKMIIDIIKKIYPKIETVNYYDINISGNNLVSLYKTKLYNITEIKQCIKDLNTKMDFMVMILFTSNLYKYSKKYLREIYYSLQFFYCILFIFSLLKKNGTCIIISFSFYTEISIELLYILKKFFKKLILTKYTVENSTSTNTKIIASRFKGISKDELDELFKIGEELSSNNKKYDSYDNKYKFIKSILDIDKTSSMYKLFRAHIIKFNIEYGHCKICYLKMLSLQALL